MTGRASAQDEVITVRLPCRACGGELPKPGDEACPECLGALHAEETVDQALVYTDDIVQFVAAYRALQRNIPPTDGGWFDQPATFVDAVTLIDSLIADIREQQRDKD